MAVYNNKSYILIIDFGSQYTHLIGQKIRSLRVYTEISYPEVILENEELLKNACGIILSGGPKSVLDPDSPKIGLNILTRYKKPILGICYGHQLIAYQLGGKVTRGSLGEYGLTKFRKLSSSPIFESLPSEFNVWMSHWDTVSSAPAGFKVIGVSEFGQIAAMENDDLSIVTLQFHPEVRHTEYGVTILDNFIKFYTNCPRDWSPAYVLKNIEREVSDLGVDRIIIGVSGGVDSTVTSVILRNILGEDKVYPVFINTGFLREGEERYVRKLYEDLGFKNLIVYDASKTFIKYLRGITNPEVKRRVFANVYMNVFEDIANKLESKVGKIRYLAQGTLYPDRIESGVASRYADRIKSHHNVVIYGKHRFILVEPLKDLYKNEVRELAKSLGLPKDVWGRHPFPGPGLLIRIIGPISERKLNILRKADKIVEEEIRKSGLYDRVWQAFPVLLSLKSVGIKGDERNYEYMIVLRIVESEDAMTANYVKLEWEILDKIARRILNEVRGVNRVLYDVSNKPPATIEFE